MLLSPMLLTSQSWRWNVFRLLITASGLVSIFFSQNPSNLSLKSSSNWFLSHWVTRIQSLKILILFRYWFYYNVGDFQICADDLCIWIFPSKLIFHTIPLIPTIMYRSSSFLQQRSLKLTSKPPGSFPPGIFIFRYTSQSFHGHVAVLSTNTTDLFIISV